MVKEDRSTWKAKYTMRLTQYLDEYPKVFVVGADNVGSRQMQKIRVSLRGHAGKYNSLNFIIFNLKNSYYDG